MTWLPTARPATIHLLETDPVTGRRTGLTKTLRRALGAIEKAGDPCRRWEWFLRWEGA